MTYISVEDIRELAEPGVYVAVMSQPGRFRYDYQTTYFYVSDLGMHLRVFEKTADVFVSSLVTGRAVSGVETSWLDANGKTGKNDAFKLLTAEGAKFTKTAGQLHFDEQGTGKNKITIVEGDTNGDGKADFQIEFSGWVHLAKGDFIL